MVLLCLFPPKDRLGIDWKIICIFKCLSQAVGVVEFFSEYNKMSKLFCALSPLPVLKIPSWLDTVVWMSMFIFNFIFRLLGQIKGRNWILVVGKSCPLRDMEVVQLFCSRAMQEAKAL